MIDFFKLGGCQLHVADKANLWIEDKISVSLDLSSPFYKEVVNFFRQASQTNEHLDLEHIRGKSDFSMHLEKVDDERRNWIVFSGQMSLVFNIPQNKLSEIADWLEKEYGCFGSGS